LAYKQNGAAARNLRIPRASFLPARHKKERKIMIDNIAHANRTFG